MLDLLNTVIHWFIQGILNIINFIRSIPVYVGYITSYITYLPTSLINIFTMAFAIFIVIKIKRLIL